jgi:hypothetical protein
MGAAGSCLGGGDVQVVNATFSRASKHTVSVSDFSRTERYLNVHVTFSSTNTSEIAVVTWWGGASCIQCKRIACKGAWLQPLNLVNVISWFQAFAFKCNLRRYDVEGHQGQQGPLQARANSLHRRDFGGGLLQVECS